MVDDEIQLLARKVQEHLRYERPGSGAGEIRAVGVYGAYNAIAGRAEEFSRAVSKATFLAQYQDVVELLDEKEKTMLMKTGKDQKANVMYVLILPRGEKPLVLARCDFAQICTHR